MLEMLTFWFAMALMAHLISVVFVFIFIGNILFSLQRGQREASHQHEGGQREEGVGHKRKAGECHGGWEGKASWERGGGGRGPAVLAGGALALHRAADEHPEKVQHLILCCYQSSVGTWVNCVKLHEFSCF